MKGSKLLGLFLTCTLAACGCAHVAGTTSAPTRQATPLEQALADNDALAQANKTIAQAVINANNGPAPLVPTASANKILIAQSRIADFDRQLTPLLASAASVSANSASITQLLTEIKLAASGVGPDLGITDAKTQTTISQSIATVISMSSLVLQTLQTGGLLK